MNSLWAVAVDCVVSGGNAIWFSIDHLRLSSDASSTRFGSILYVYVRAAAVSIYSCVGADLPWYLDIRLCYEVQPALFGCWLVGNVTLPTYVGQL